MGDLEFYMRRTINKRERERERPVGLRKRYRCKHISPRERQMKVIVFGQHKRMQD